MTIISTVRLSGMSFEDLMDEIAGSSYSFENDIEARAAYVLRRTRLEMARERTPSYAVWAVLRDVLAKEFGLFASDREYDSWVRLLAFPDVPFLKGVIRMLSRQAAERRRMKARSRRLGLAYWPALHCGGVDPAAFLAAETVLSGLSGSCYGQRDEKGNLLRGGWDSAGFYGVSAHQVKRIWFKAGCRDSRKFRAMVAWSFQRRAAVDNLRKGDSLPFARNFLRGSSWMANVNLDARMSRKAIAALGRLSPWARWAAISGLKELSRERTVRVRDLNWEEVRRLQGKPVRERVVHCPAGLAWQLVHGRRVPRGLAGVSPVGFNRSTYEALCGIAGLDPYEGDDRPSGLRYRLITLTRLFGTVRRVRRFVHGELDRYALYEAGDFSLPKGDGWHRAAWRRMVFNHPDVVTYGSAFESVEALHGGVPRTVPEIAALAAKCRYQGIESDRDLRVAEMAFKLRMRHREFERYRNLFRKEGKAWEDIPDFEVRGEEVGLDAAWRIRRLAADDPIGPALGRLTCSWQHLEGSGSASARSGYLHPDAAFAVVEYRGRIAAQSFLWRAMDRDVVVFDAVDARFGFQVEAVAVLVREAARRLVGKLGVEGVRFGDCHLGITSGVRKYLAGVRCNSHVVPHRTHYRGGLKQWAIPCIPS